MSIVEVKDLCKKYPEFTLDSRIVTLSTCTGDSSTRFVVQGILGG